MIAMRGVGPVRVLHTSQEAPSDCWRGFTTSPYIEKESITQMQFRFD